ncbi:MAG: hypothetical protein ATN36_04120 [Epulopiscium sp. Nele67-Bin005]|nr:MAG: hypothetical protein ATN36_04120 [Epulopiscium sp. Nele67-Bin005]
MLTMQSTCNLVHGTFFFFQTSVSQSEELTFISNFKLKRMGTHRSDIIDIIIDAELANQIYHENRAMAVF